MRRPWATLTVALLWRSCGRAGCLRGAFYESGLAPPALLPSAPTMLWTSRAMSQVHLSWLFVTQSQVFCHSRVDQTGLGEEREGKGRLSVSMSSGSPCCRGVTKSGGLLSAIHVLIHLISRIAPCVTGGKAGHRGVTLPSYRVGKSEAA